MRRVCDQWLVCKGLVVSSQHRVNIKHVRLVSDSTVLAPASGGGFLAWHLRLAVAADAL